MTKMELQNFVDNYTSADFDKIKATTQNKEEQRLLNDFIRNRIEYYANK